MSERIGRYELVAPRPGQENTFLARRRGAGAFERYVVVRVVDMSGEAAGMLRLQADEVLWPLGHLHHQHLRNVIDVEEHADRLLIVTEYVHGSTVRDVLDGGAQLPYDFGLTVVAHVASALHHMHTRTSANGKPLGIIHRELSPSMLWVGYEGAIKLGLPIPVGRTIGPGVDYMSPEQVQGKPIGVTTDVFSLGAVLYELTTGQRPFQEATERMTLMRIKGATYAPPSQVIANFPPELEAIITKALQAEPGARYESAEAMRSAIAALGHHYELVLGDAAIVEVMSQLFDAPKEPWLLPATPTPEPTSDGALAYDFDLPSVRPQRNPMRSATELVEQLSSILEPATGRPRTPVPGLPEAHDDFDHSVPTRMAPKAVEVPEPHDEFDQSVPTRLAPTPGAIPEAHDEFEPSVPTRMAATPAEVLAAATPSAAERVSSIQRLFTESAFDPRETPATPIAQIEEDATRRHVTDRGIVDLGATTDGVPLLPATVVSPPTPAPVVESSSTKRIVLIALALIVLGALGIAGYWFATRDDGEAAASDPPRTPLDPDGGPQLDTATPPRDTVAPDAAVVAPPDAAATVRLKITSIPSTATVLLDGKRLGKTPFEGTAELVGKGPHAVKVRLTGYNTVKLDIVGDSLEKDVVLVKPKPKADEPPE